MELAVIAQQQGTWLDAEERTEHSQVQKPFPKLQWQRLERSKDKETCVYRSGKNSCGQSRLKEATVALGPAHTHNKAVLHTHCKDQYLLTHTQKYTQDQYTSISTLLSPTIHIHMYNFLQTSNITHLCPSKSNMQNFVCPTAPHRSIISWKHWENGQDSHPVPTTPCSQPC